MTSKKEPAEVERLEVVVGDAHAVLTLNEAQFALRPDQVHSLRRKLNAAFVELH